MIRLLSIEFYKLKHNRASKILTLVYFGLLTSIALVGAIRLKIGPIEFRFVEQGIFNFPYIWHFSTYISAIFKFFLLLVIVSMMANEYSYKTLKQNLIDGLSKREFILSKFYMVTALSLVSTVFVFLISLILGLIYSDNTEFSVITSDLDYLFAFFIKLLGFFSFGLFLGILIKRSAFAVGAMFIWSIIEVIIKLLLFFSFGKSTEISQKVLQFFPLEAMSNLIKEPFSRMKTAKEVADKIGGEINNDYSVHLFDIIVVLAWTFIFVYLSYRLLKKRDL